MFLLKPNSSLLLSSADYTRFAIFLSLLSSYASCIWSSERHPVKPFKKIFSYSLFSFDLILILEFPLISFFFCFWKFWSSSVIFLLAALESYLLVLSPLFWEILILISCFLTCSCGKNPLFAPISFWSLLWFICMFCFFFVSIRYHNFFYFSIWNIV